MRVSWLGNPCFAYDKIRAESTSLLIQGLSTTRDSQPFYQYREKSCAESRVRERLRIAEGASRAPYLSSSPKANEGEASASLLFSSLASPKAKRDKVHRRRRREELRRVSRRVAKGEATLRLTIVLLP
jgi:hypothetical protein